MEQCRPVAEGTVAVVHGGIVVVDGAQAVKNQRSLDVHSVHDANGERFRLVAVQERERPFGRQFW